MAVDYTCAECGRSICLITADEVPECAICGPCTFCPGWFRDPEIRAILDPDHDGTEMCDRAPGTQPCL